MLAGITALVPTVVAHATSSGSRWTTAAKGSPFAAAAVGDRVYLLSHKLGKNRDRENVDVEILDLPSEHPIARVQLGDSLSVADDDSFTTQGDETVYYDAAGKQRWHRRGGSQVLAIHDGAVFLDRCGRRPTGCAIAPDGHVAWQGHRRRVRWLGSLADGTPVAEPVVDTSGYVNPAPQVAAAQLPDHRVAIYSADGDPIATVPGQGLGIAGNLVLVFEGQCEIAAFRGGHEAWHIGLPSCSDLLSSGALSPVLLERHLFVNSSDPKRTYAVDLSDGSSHTFGELNPDYLKLGIPGDDVVIERDFSHLTGRDPDTGRVLWTYHADDPEAEVMIENGAVTISGKSSPSHRWLLGLTGRGDESDETVEVLDARTGQLTGRVSADTVTDVHGVGRGRAAVLVDGTLRVIGR